MIGLLTSRLAGPAATIVALILLALCVGQCTGRVKAEHRLAAAEKARVVAVRDLTTCQTNTDTLKSSLQAQNAAVDALKYDSDARVAESAKAVSAARSVAESRRREVERLLAAKPKGADLCKEADRLIEETIR